MGMHLTQGGSVQMPLTSGPRGWPADRPHFAASHQCASRARSSGGGNKESKLEVGGSQTRWLAGHVAGPTGQHLACY
jgi:hypothetical protein